MADQAALQSLSIPGTDGNQPHSIPDVSPGQKRHFDKTSLREEVNLDVVSKRTKLDISRDSPLEGPGKEADEDKEDDEEEEGLGTESPASSIQIGIVPHDEPAQVTANWNSGIQQGIRTSFSMSASKPSPFPRPRQQARKASSTKPSLEEGAEANIPESRGVPEKDAGDSEDKLATWNLPPFPEEARGERPRWDKLFIGWCEDFCTLNQAELHRANATELKRGYIACIKKASSLSHKQRQLARNGMITSCKVENIINRVRASTPTADAAADADAVAVEAACTGAAATDATAVDATAAEAAAAAVDATAAEATATATDGVDVAIADAAGTDAVGAGLDGLDVTGSVTSDIPPLNGDGNRQQRYRMTPDEELRQLHLYFPGASETDFCVLCARSGHRATDGECPELRCRHCGTNRHTSSECPTRERCRKCHQLGHSESTCTQTLALAPGEARDCAFCSAVDHTEEACEAIWRTFRADTTNTLKVNTIPAFCYRCGSNNHFGGDCGLASAVSPRLGVAKDATWSLANRDRFLDAEELALPVSWVPPPPPDDTRPDFGGRSIAPQTHEQFFESDDDDDGDFIKPPVRRQQQRQQGQIRVNTTAGGGSRRDSASNQARGAGNFGSYGGHGLPSLPPGPPPPLPPPNFGHGHGRGPSHGHSNDNNRQGAPPRGRGGRGRGSGGRGGGGFSSFRSRRGGRGS